MLQESGSNLVKIGIDLTDFYLSVEWDILEVPAARNEEYYPCCEEPYSGKKTLFTIQSILLTKQLILSKVIKLRVILL